LNAREFLAPLAAIDGQDQKLRSLAGLHAADSLACLIAGAQTLEGRALTAFYRSDGVPEPFAAAAAAAAVIRFTEWDDIHVPSCVTPGAVAVPAALAFAADEASFSAAMASGYAIGTALGEAIGGVSALPETWPGLFAAPAIAAIATSTALGLAPEIKAQALVLALAGSSGRHGRPSGTPSARWLVIGEATLKGIRAAFAARAGFKGDLDLLSPGWLRAQSGAAGEWQLPRPDAIRSVGLKPVVAARQGMNAIEAFRRLIAAGMEPGAIEEIRVSLPPAAVAVVSRPLNLEDRLSTIAHLGLQLGIAAFEPERLSDVGRALPFGPDARSLAERVVIVADEALCEGAGWPAKVAVRIGAEWVEQACPSIPGEDGDESRAREFLGRKFVSIRDVDPKAERVFEALLAMETGAVRRASEMLYQALAIQGTRGNATRPNGSSVRETIDNVKRRSGRETREERQ